MLGCWHRLVGTDKHFFSFLISPLSIQDQPIGIERTGIIRGHLQGLLRQAFCLLQVFAAHRIMISQPVGRPHIALACRLIGLGRHGIAVRCYHAFNRTLIKPIHPGQPDPHRLAPLCIGLLAHGNRFLDRANHRGVRPGGIFLARRIARHGLEINHRPITVINLLLGRGGKHILCFPLRGSFPTGGKAQKQTQTKKRRKSTNR